MAESLSIKYQPHPLPDRIVDVEVLHTQDIFIDIELAEVPYDRAQRLHGELVAFHLADWGRNTVWKQRVGRIVLVHGNILAGSRWVNSFELLESFLVFQPFDGTERGPQAVGREHGLQQGLRSFRQGSLYCDCVSKKHHLKRTLPNFFEQDLLRADLPHQSFQARAAHVVLKGTQVELRSGAVQNAHSEPAIRHEFQLFAGRRLGFGGSRFENSDAVTTLVVR